MPTLAMDNAGDNIFTAEERSTFPIFGVAATSDLNTWAAAYDPGAGTAGNVIAAGDDTMIFYGNFGTDVTIQKHTISTVSNVDISPSSLGAKVVNTLAVNPSDTDEMICTVDTDQDALHTTDGGTIWTTIDSALGFNATALWALWSGVYFPHRLFVAGDNLTTLDLLYSPNLMTSSQDFAGTSLDAAANISGVEI